MVTVCTDSIHRTSIPRMDPLASTPAATSSPWKSLGGNKFTKTGNDPIEPAMTGSGGSDGKHQRRKRSELRRQLTAQAQRMQA